MKQHAYIDGQRDRDAEKLSPAQWEVLADLADDSGRHFARNVTTTTILARKGMIHFNRADHRPSLTDAGRRLLRVQWRNA